MLKGLWWQTIDMIHMTHERPDDSVIASTRRDFLNHCLFSLCSILPFFVFLAITSRSLLRSEKLCLIRSVVSHSTLLTSLLPVEDITSDFKIHALNGTSLASIRPFGSSDLFIAYPATCMFGTSIYVVLHN